MARQVGQFTLVGVAALVLVGLGTALASRGVGEREAIVDARTTALAKALGAVEPVVTDGLLTAQPAAVRAVADLGPRAPDTLHAMARGEVGACVHHPLFARFYARFAPGGERVGIAEHRDRMLGGLRGRVVEVGAGNGLNFAHYPDTVTDVVAVEPEPYLRERAEDAARRASVGVVVVDGVADALPLPDASVDAGVTSLVLCSVPEPAHALAELRRVIRPGGELRFYEHVAATDPRWARRQRLVEPVWKRMGGGCHLARDTEQEIRDAGFEVESCERFLFAPCIGMRLVAPHVLGAARRP